MVRRTRRGGSAIEAALTLPALLALLAGAMDYGWFFTEMHVMGDAVREGARSAAVAAAAGAEEAVATDRAAAVWTASGLPGVPTYRVGLSPESVTVTGSLKFRALFGLVPAPDAVTVSATAPLQERPSS